MKKLSLLSLSILLGLMSFPQTGIGTTTPDASAKLDIYANNKGFLPPRVTLTSYTDISTIPNPATGLLIYNTGSNVGLAAGYYYWNGNAWATIATAGGSGSFAASFLRGSRTASQSSIAVGGIVSFSAVDNTSGQDIALNTSNGKITLAPGNTYRLIAAVPNFSGNRPAFMWYNETSSSYIGSATNGYSPTDGASGAGAFGGIAEVIITPNVSTVLSFRLLSSLSSGAITVGGLADFSSTGSYPWFEAQVISGNAPVTGQSVDYVSVNRTTLQTVNTGDNIIFNTINSGNIPYNSSNGNFTLTAGKTYRLTGSVSLDGSNAGSAEIDIAWKNAAGDVLGNRALILSTNFSSTATGNGVTDIIYTPTVNTTIALNVVYATANAKTVSNYTFATITQIGSSAIVNPWTLSGTNTYNTTGNVGIGTNAPAAKLDVNGDVNVTGKINLTDATGNVATKAAGFVDAGVYVTLDNIKATVTTSGNRNISIATVSGTVNMYYSGIYLNGGLSGSRTTTAGTFTTTDSGSLFGWTFGSSGDTVIYQLIDPTNNRAYRITLVVMPSYIKNFISIERLN